MLPQVLLLRKHFLFPVDATTTMAEGPNRLYAAHGFHSEFFKILYAKEPPIFDNNDKMNKNELLWPKQLC